MTDLVLRIRSHVLQVGIALGGGCHHFIPPPPLCPGTALRTNRPMVSNSCTTFFYHRIGFFVVLGSYSGVQDNISCVLHGLRYLEGHICFCTISSIPCYVP